MLEPMSGGVLDINKKINYITRLETMVQIY